MNCPICNLPLRTLSAKLIACNLEEHAYYGYADGSSSIYYDNLIMVRDNKTHIRKRFADKGIVKTFDYIVPDDQIKRVMELTSLLA